MKFEFFKYDILQANSKFNFKFGMSEEYVAHLLKGYEYFHSKIFLKYPNKEEHLEERFTYDELNKLTLTYFDGVLVAFFIPVSDNTLLFEDINLFDNNYKATLKKLKKRGYGYFYEKSLISESFYVEKLGLDFILFDNKFQKIRIDSKFYQERSKNDGKYWAKMHTKDNDTVIKYTNIPKEYCDK